MARLIETRVPRDPHGLVLVLHGGASRQGSPAVSPTQLSVLRMIPIAGRIARADRRLAVVRLLNTTRGWDSTHTPVDDARWALEQLHERFGDLPTALVGHSLGGRAALLTGDQPGVRSVVALNPWLYADDGRRVDLAGREVLFVHGTDDRIARPAPARATADALARTADVTWVDVDGAKHAMLRHGRRFETLAADFVRRTLLEDSPRPR